MVGQALSQLDELRLEIKKENTNVALEPEKGYHFHTGCRAAWLILSTISEVFQDFACHCELIDGNALALGSEISLLFHS